MRLARDPEHGLLIPAACYSILRLALKYMANEIAAKMTAIIQEHNPTHLPAWQELEVARIKMIYAAGRPADFAEWDQSDLLPDSSAYKSRQYRPEACITPYTHLTHPL